MKSEYILNFVKIIISICLLGFGGYILLWLINLIQHIVYSAESIPIIQTFMAFEPTQQVLNLNVNGDDVILTGNGIAKWVIFALIFIILFNILGRSIASMFSGAVKILIDTKFNKQHSGQYVSTNNEEFTCDYCGTSYNPSEYRSGAVVRCENCNKVVQPKY